MDINESKLQFKLNRYLRILITNPGCAKFDYVVLNGISASKKSSTFLEDDLRKYKRRTRWCVISGE